MKTIKTKIFSNLELLSVTTRSLQQSAVQELLMDVEIKNELYSVLKKTGKVKPKKVELGKKGVQIPVLKQVKKDENTNENLAFKGLRNLFGNEFISEEEHQEMIKEAEKEAKEADEKNFENNFKSLVITFINSLIIRNGKITWDKGVKITDLFEKFHKDKLVSKTFDCECKAKPECEDHNNLYERVYCDIKTYTEDQSDEKIRNLIELLFTFLTSESHAQLKFTLQSYIDIFIDEINLGKNKHKGGFRHRTFKKKRIHK